MAKVKRRSGGMRPDNPAPKPKGPIACPRHQEVKHPNWPIVLNIPSDAKHPRIEIRVEGG